MDDRSVNRVVCRLTLRATGKGRKISKKCCARAHRHPSLSCVPFRRVSAARAPLPRHVVSRARASGAIGAARNVHARSVARRERRSDVPRLVHRRARVSPAVCLPRQPAHGAGIARHVVRELRNRRGFLPPPRARARLARRVLPTPTRAAPPPPVRVGTTSRGRARHLRAMSTRAWTVQRTRMAPGSPRWRFAEPVPLSSSPSSPRRWTATRRRARQRGADQSRASSCTPI